MTRPLATGFVIAAGVTLTSALGADPGAERRDAIRRAQVWKSTPVGSMNLRTGPTGPGAFAPEATIHCTYLDKKMAGRSPKFACVIPPEDELKVKYGPDNGEVYAEVAASRLLWALGFGADHMYPVRVVCQGCPADITGTEVSAVERKMPGREIESDIETGWAWRELDLVDPEQGGAPRAHRDALKLLAVFLQHTDSKAGQQRLACLDDPEKDASDNGECKAPFMFMQDVGLTFGRATKTNGAGSSASLADWAATPIWKDPARCIGNMRKSMTGTLKDPEVSEEGRKFLAGLLDQLSDRQLRDLFETSRFDRRAAPGGKASLQAWVDAFKKKRSEIADHTCPN